MPPPNQNAVADGVSTTMRGMHCGIAPRLLPPNQLAFAINLTHRGGLPRTRPVWRKVPLVYPDDTTRGYATQALWQKAAFYQAYGSMESCLLASIGGRQFRYLVGSNNNVQEVTIKVTADVVTAFTVPAVGGSVAVNVNSTKGLYTGAVVEFNGPNVVGFFTVGVVVDAAHLTLVNVSAVPGTVAAVGDTFVFNDRNDSLNPNCWMWQGEDFITIQNGQANPLFWDGAAMRRSKGAPEELPPGCMGCYVQGRNWMVLPDDNQLPSQNFMAGDLVYSHGFGGAFNGRDAVLRIEENTLFSGGGAFSVPVNAGPITSMFTVAIADTSLGQGPLQVGTLSSVFSVQVPLNRTDWAATQYPLMTVGLPNYGPTGAEAVAIVNGDAWYRSLDGTRSYQVGRRDLNTWVQTPLSVEVERILAFDTDELLGRASSVYFNNRWLVTCSPREVRNRGTAWLGLVALDFNNISNLTTRSEPDYDGLWTGLGVLQVLKGTWRGVERCFAFALDAQGDICLYELLKDGDGYHDNNGTQDVNVQWELESRAMGWSDGGNKLKKLLAAEAYVERLAGAVGGPSAATGAMSFDFKYRSDQDPCWHDWHAFELCAPIKDCAAGCGPLNVREQYRTYLRLPDPPDGPDQCSPVTKRQYRTGYEFQVRMAGAGHWELNRLHVWAEYLRDSPISACPTTEACQVVKCCELPWFGYLIEPPAVPAPPGGGIPGILWEDPDIFIETETPGIIIRREDQTPVGPGGGGGGGTPTPNLPSWPVPTPLACAGRLVFIAPDVFDPMRGVTRGVAVPNGVFTPPDYINIISPSPAACLSEWVSWLWGQFVTATGGSFSAARVIWTPAGLTGQNFNAIHVWPGMPGMYPFTDFTGVAEQWALAIEYCP